MIEKEPAELQELTDEQLEDGNGGKATDFFRTKGTNVPYAAGGKRSPRRSMRRTSRNGTGRQSVISQISRQCAGVCTPRLFVDC